MTRLQQLKKRREILISLNNKNNYTQSEHPKIQKYYNCILRIRKEINDIECNNFKGFLNVQYGFTIEDLRNLTSPKKNKTIVGNALKLY